MQFQTPNRIGELSSVWASRHFPWYEMLWIYGTKGSVHNVGGVHLESQSRPDSERGFVRLTLPEADSFTEEIRHFAECIRTGRTPLTNGYEGLKSLEVVIAAYRAQATGSVVQMENMH